MSFTSTFASRHLGPSDSEVQTMLQTLEINSIDELIQQTLPSSILNQKPLKLGSPLTENETIQHLRTLASKNKLFKNFIGQGYVGTLTPHVILRNVLENPGWYTQYTPYQAEISQGRLEALLNFQTMIIEMTGLEIANASLLDESTAAAEAMAMAYSLQNKPEEKEFWIDEESHPQTLAVVETRARYQGIRVKKISVSSLIKNKSSLSSCFGVFIQYPNTRGEILDLSPVISEFKKAGVLCILGCDLMSLALIKSPGELGADIAIGNTQCFGVPMGYGGPHAAFIACKDAHRRLLPGRVVGVSKDSKGNLAYRLALQTREQHIRRDKATSNICTAQVLLAIMSSFYAVYHGPVGIRQIAEEIHRKTSSFWNYLDSIGFKCEKNFFNTLTIQTDRAKEFYQRALDLKINIRLMDSHHLSLCIDESTQYEDLDALAKVFGDKKFDKKTLDSKSEISLNLKRTTPYLKHGVFNRYHTETEMLRYITKLQSKDLSLAQSMIPLGSCTMKLNATTEMLAVTWPEFANLHPFIPLDQAQGYQTLFAELESQLSEITGFDAVSLQPNAGSQGEYAGLLTIRAYQESIGESHRNICLIPSSAHGTNPASAVMAGLQVVVVECDSKGNINLQDLELKAKEHSKNLSALMITYPSTHGVFESHVKNLCEIIHANGGQVYMDGANMNAQVGLCKPGEIGADVCHLNLHKTFCIPHGGGGPGMGPIGVKSHLKKFLPNHPVIPCGGEQGFGPVSAAPWGSSSILPIPYSYILMMGAEGLKKATQIAILSANYITEKLAPHYPVLYRGEKNRVAHECIIDIRGIKERCGVDVEDIAKRLMDYGFHAPTISFPVAGTLMIEPTESESLYEINRFCEAMISIRSEIQEIIDGKSDAKNNVLKNAPHTQQVVCATEWNYNYSREKAVYPVVGLRDYKFWPSISRIDNVYGDRNFSCSCPPMDSYS